MLPNACPKPKPTVKPPKGLRKVNRARKTLDDARVYGPPARRKRVNLQPCAACGVWGYSVNAHVLGNDGAGRKNGYKTIAPLCDVRPHSLPNGAPLYEGCHHLFDTDQTAFRAEFPEFSPAKAARDTQRRWLAFLKSEKSND